MKGGRVVVPQIHGWIERLLRLSGSKHPASRSYRYLARQLARDFRSGGRENCVAMLTSPAPLELSTDSLLMFSYFLQAELEADVLLVDATLRKDGVGGRLGVGGQPGFMDALLDDTLVPADLICPTGVRGISIMPAGKGEGSNVRTMSRALAERVISALRTKADYVLVQQGSILEDTRFLPMMNTADVVLLLVEEGATLLDDLEACQKLLRDHDVANVRLVLSGSR